MIFTDVNGTQVMCFPKWECDSLAGIFFPVVLIVCQPDQPLSAYPYRRVRSRARPCKMNACAAAISVDRTSSASPKPLAERVQ